MFSAIRKRSPADGPFYKQRGWRNSAGFLGLLVVMSLVALLSGVTTGRSVDGETEVATVGRDELSGLTGPLSPGDPQQVRSGPGGRPENCRTDDRNTARPTTTPTDLRWRELVGIMVPTSPTAGPLHTDTSVWWCFAHTPTGAVLAAHVIPVQLSGAAWRSAAEQQVVPGTPRDEFVAGMAEKGTTDLGESAIGRFVGFSLSSYAAGSATVRLLLTNPAGGYLSTSVSVRWRDGDWKVAPHDDGSLYSVVRQAQPGDFAAWGD
ncbi:hypothetical protein [Streptomyces ziwulingensis]|uniref:DUF8175 domain-containing protein n=1 Tax=Streptomyces ziwulingensis TaxID=1045501 RepID=A0ABP9AZA4_9ACTN